MQLNFSKIRKAIPARSLLSVCVRCAAAVALAFGLMVQSASAVDTSAPAILQWFDSSFEVQEDRLADFFMSGYGGVWIPPANRADSGNLSVGYDPYDRFDLGSAGNRTLYGTQTGLTTFANRMHRLGGNVYVDLVWNHNGFSEAGTPQFLEAGGYPGFVLQNPDGGNDPFGVPGTDGDHHSIFAGGDLDGRIAGLLDINHSTNFTLIRQPVVAGDPLNIPAGTSPDLAGRIANLPNTNNARFYPDQSLTPIFLFDPSTGENNIAVYPYNTATPLAGDAVPENALGLLMRNARWMVEVVGVDGFRLDAARHFEPWVMPFFDRAVYRANQRTLLDGTQQDVFSFSEAASSDRGIISSNYILNNIDPNDPGRIGGNRDALDFAQFFALRTNLQENGQFNDWRNVVFAGQDHFDDGLLNGSAGVTFAQSHDDFGPPMQNVAYAYLLMRPGNTNVYYNARQHGDERAFPKPGSTSALGNFDGEVANLVSIRNSHGRGNYRERWLEQNLHAYERSGSALVLLSNRNDAGFDDRTLQVDQAVGTYLVELTGNAANSNAQTGTTDIPELLQVFDNNGTPSVNARFLRSGGQDQGYLIYGLQTPQSTAGITLTNVSQILAGGTPDPQSNFSLGTTRLTDLNVVTADQFDVTLATQAVNLLGSIRDQDADGDNALIKINDGIDLNNNGVVDFVTPGSVVYGFEQFTDTRNPGFDATDGNGLYQQTIDATQLPEGMNFITVRAFRHRTDGGPAVFSDFRSVVYVDRLPPESAIASFEPFGAAPEDLDLVVRSVDQTANNVHVFANLGAAVPDATILALVSGLNQASQVDRDIFKFGVFDVAEGNNAVTVVTFEQTGNVNIQRFTGLSPATGRGAGLGDTDFNGTLETSDIQLFNQVLYSQDLSFNPAADVNADGKVDNNDLYALDDILLAQGASQAVLDEYVETLLARGDFNGQDGTNDQDIDVLYSGFGLSNWFLDLNTDGVVDEADVETLVVEVARSQAGDFDLDGDVDGSDFLAWQTGFGTAANARYYEGDANIDGAINADDFSVLASNFGFTAAPLQPLPSISTSVPEPTTCSLVVLLAASVFLYRRK